MSKVDTNSVEALRYNISLEIEKSKITMYRICKASGADYAALHRFMSGKNNNMSLRYLDLIAKGLGKSPGYMLRGIPEDARG